MSYSPPAGNELDLDFVDAYSPPAGGALVLDFVPAAAGTTQSVLAVSAGYRPQVFGNPVLRNTRQYVRPSSWLSGATGSVLVENQLPGFGPSGFASSTFGNVTAYKPSAQFVAAFSRPSTLAFGAVTIELIRIYVYASPIASRALVGRPAVEDALKIAAPPSIAPGPFGVPYVADYFQHIGGQAWVNAQGYGSALVSARIRYVGPTGVPSTAMPAPVVYAYLQQIRPSDIESLRMGTPELFRDARWIYPGGIGPRLAWGVPAVIPRDATVLAVGIPAQEPSRGIAIANKNRVIQHAQDFGFFAAGLHVAANINRVLGAAGFSSGRVSNGQMNPYVFPLDDASYRWVAADDVLGLQPMLTTDAAEGVVPVSYHQQLDFWRATRWFPEYIFTAGEHRYVVGYRENYARALLKFNRRTGEFLGRVRPRVKVRWNNAGTITNYEGLYYASGAPDLYLEGFIEYDPLFDGSGEFDGDGTSTNWHRIQTCEFRDGYLYFSAHDFTTSSAAVYWGSLWGGTTGGGAPLWGGELLMFNGIRRIGPFDGGTVFSNMTVEGPTRDTYIPDQLVTYLENGGLFGDTLNDLLPLVAIDLVTLQRGGNYTPGATPSRLGAKSTAITAGGWNYFVEAIPVTSGLPTHRALRRRNPTTAVVDSTFEIVRRSKGASLWFDGTVLWVQFFPSETGGVAPVRYGLVPATGRRAFDPLRDDTRVQVYNLSPTVAPAGLAPAAPGRATVTYRVRSVRPDTWESSFAEQWNAVRNAARAVGAAGVRLNQSWGLPAIALRNRTLVAPPVQEASTPQAALVAYRIRTVGHWFPYTGSRFPIPEVRLDPYPIAPAGIDSYRTGVPGLLQRFNQFFPSSIPPRNFQVAEPTILNVDRELRTVGLDQALYGRTTVQLLRRFVFPIYPGGSILGRHVIADTDRTFGVPSIGAQSFVPTGAVVAYTSITPFTTRYLFAMPIPQEGLGSAVIGAPLVRSNSIFPQAFVSSFIPRPVMRGNTLYPAPANTPDSANRFGVTRVSGPQYIRLGPTKDDFEAETGGKGINSPEYGKPRLSPYTIWATFDATVQARVNNGGRSWEYIDGLRWGVDTSGTGWWPGHIPAVISLKNRRLPAGSVPFDPELTSSVFGQAAADLKERRLAADGWRSSRFGIATLPNSPREIIQSPVVASSALGTATVKDPGTVAGVLSIRLAGHGPQSSVVPEEAFVAGKIRYVAPAAFVYLYVEAGQPPLELSQPPGAGTPRVHPPEPLLVEGIAPPAASTAHMISWRIRWAYAVGEDESELLYQFGPLTGRMRVANRTIEPTTSFPGQAVSPQPASAGLAPPPPTVYNRSHFVDVDCMCPLGVQPPTVTHA